MIKKLAVVVILSLLLICGASYAEDNGEVLIEIDGLTHKACITNDVVYLPLRSVFEKMGYTVQWREENGNSIIAVAKDGENVLINLTSKTIAAGGYTASTIISRGEGVIIKDNRVCLADELLSEFFAFDARYDEQNRRIVLERINKNQIIVKTLEVVSDSDELKITVRFPQVFGLSNPDVQDNINSIFRQAALNAENEGLKNAYELEKTRQQGYTGSPNKCETYFEYRLKYNQNGLLGIILMDYQYAGGAHGSTVQKSYTFDLNTGQELKLSDLMRSDADYVQYISSSIRSEIDKRAAAGILNELPGSAFETISAEPDFYLSGSQLYIYFQQYEHFPYAAGIQEFPIAYSGLKAMLKEEFWFLK